MNTKCLFIVFQSKLFRTAILFISLAFNQSCNKLLDVPPPVDMISDESVYSNDESAIAILTGIYVSMSQPAVGGGSGYVGVDGFPFLNSLYADEMYAGATGVKNGRFYTNSLVPGDGGRIWLVLYNYIYRANAAIEGISASQSLSTAVKQQLLGEAYFLRAFHFFYLANLYGGVPLAKTSNYKANTLLPRASIEDVYQLIIDDLIFAQENLSEIYLSGGVNRPSDERVRPSKWAATLLLARAYLFQGNYQKAEAEATKVVDKADLFNLPALNDVFLKNSKEAIWQLQPVNVFFCTEDAKYLVLTSGFSGQTPAYINPGLLNSFESGDHRAIPKNWVDTIRLENMLYYFPYKYKAYALNTTIDPTTGTRNMTEYYMMLRLAEQYLIRAESRAQLDNLSGAISDLDQVRQRAGLPSIASTNPDIGKQDLVDLIIHERRVELFTEWCNRWFDLKRTGKIDEIMSVEAPLKGGIWEAYKALYPIGTDELQYAPNLEQNPGYPKF